MKYLISFNESSSKLGTKVKDINKLNNLFSLLGVKFAYRYQSAPRCKVKFYFEENGLFDIGNAIFKYKEEKEVKEIKIGRISFIGTIEGQDSVGNFEFKLTSDNTYKQIIDRLLEFFEENVSDSISVYSKPIVTNDINNPHSFNHKTYNFPMFRNIIIEFTKYLTSTDNPDENYLGKIIGKELSKSGADFKTLDYIKTNNKKLWDCISNGINDIGADMGNLGF